MARFLIDGVEVSEAEFERLFRRLKSAGGWTCAEFMVDGHRGGEVRERMRTRSGRIYQYVQIGHPMDGETRSLERLPK